MVFGFFMLIGSDGWHLRLLLFPHSVLHIMGLVDPDWDSTACHIFYHYLCSLEYDGKNYEVRKLKVKDFCLLCKS